MVILTHSFIYFRATRFWEMLIYFVRRKYIKGGTKVFFFLNNDFRDICQPKNPTYGPNFLLGFGTSRPIALCATPISLYGGHQRSPLFFIQTQAYRCSNERSRSPEQCYIIIFRIGQKMSTWWTETHMSKYGRKC